MNNIVLIMVISSLCAVSFVNLLTKKDEVFGFWPNIVMAFWRRFLKKENGQLKFDALQKPIMSCSKCMSAWIFLVTALIVEGPSFILVPATIVTPLFTDMINRIFKYEA